ncbi:MAG: phosphatidylglycerophosphatase A [Rhodospirillales bacterium]|nr:phosphatidylglycerophosphatase A [Rhodospirillales bacterium]
MTNNVNQAQPSLVAPGVLLATWFGVGYLPKAPGTWGSAAALPFAWVILSFFGAQGLLVATVFVFGIGIWAANDYVARSGMEDPGPVVIDEVAGQWLVLAVVPLELAWFAIGFALFRLFDVAKPWPVNLMDRHIKGGFGVMLDDIGAGIYAIIAVYALQWAWAVW